ncbi:homoserine dehydrogenase-like [Hibiscus syriacus]|uniref:homoserine dehydrogenase-like n=1 Tax=Hibiscus syriacus TaxID=106335 RepID=UPI001923F4A2|nr:homoserine dehydrogenase-like [Hibiscus syriacus]
MLDIATILGKSTGLALVDCTASSETIGVLKGVDLGRIMTNWFHILDTHRMSNCTLGYLMNEVEDCKPLSQVVRSAKSLGYTEPDPRDDLSGMDVARKFQMNMFSMFLISTLFFSDMNRFNFKLALQHLPVGFKLDAKHDIAIVTEPCSLLSALSSVRIKGYTLGGRSLKMNWCDVGIQELPKNSALGRLRGSDNMLEIYSQCYSEQPLVIQGAGAGNDTTAAGVLADILDIQNLFPLKESGSST